MSPASQALLYWRSMAAAAATYGAAMLVPDR